MFENELLYVGAFVRTLRAKVTAIVQETTEEGGVDEDLGGLLFVFCSSVF